MALTPNSSRPTGPAVNAGRSLKPNRVVLRSDESGPDDRRRHRARRGPPAEQTAVHLALDFGKPDAERDEVLVRILAAALVADFIEESRVDGRNPVGNRPSTEEGR